MVRGLLCVALLLVTVTAHAETWPDKAWAKGTPLDGAAVDALNAYAFPTRDDATRQGIRTDALLVIRDGVIIYERYAAPTTADTPHLTWSVSKSLMATVLGVAYGEHRFKLSDPAARFYPPMKQHPKVTLADLLHWASGLDWQEDYEYAPLKSSVVAMLYTRGRADMAEFAADTEAAAAPGQAFRYSSGDSAILSATLKGMLGHKAYVDYPWEALFKPLGIHNATWETDADETFVASSYAYLTARDLARVGLLMARDGRWGAAIAAQRVGRFQPPTLRQIPARPGRSRPRRPMVAQPRSAGRPPTLARCAGRHVRRSRPLGPGVVCDAG